MSQDIDRVSEHLKYWCPKGTPSTLGYRVVQMFEILECGLHHCDNEQMAKVDWTNPFCIKVNYYARGGLSTWDFNRLTVLVFLAHDFGIRVEIYPCNFAYFKLLFHQRYAREGDICDRHPTIEQALEVWRRLHSSRELPAIPSDPGTVAMS
jgi:hypothetical protein